MKSYTDDRSVFGSQANLFDATYASASVAGSNVALITDRTTATIRLKRSGGTIGTANFPMFAINGSFMFTNPSEVTSWVRSNAPEADEYEISLDTISFEKKAGTNVVVVEWLYDDSVLSGGSWSGYSPANGSGGSNQQQ